MYLSHLNQKNATTLAGNQAQQYNYGTYIRYGHPELGVQLFVLFKGFDYIKISTLCVHNMFWVTI